MYIQHLLDFGFAHGPNALLHYLPALEHQNGRDAAHLVAHGGLTVLIHVQFADLGLALFCGKLGEFLRTAIGLSSVSGRPAAKTSEASSGHRKALRAARRKARTRIPELVSAFRASNSARSAFESGRATPNYREPGRQ